MWNAVDVTTKDEARESLIDFFGPRAGMRARPNTARPLTTEVEHLNPLEHPPT